MRFRLARHNSRRQDGTRIPFYQGHSGFDFVSQLPEQPSNFGAFVGLGGYDVLGDTVVVTLPLTAVHMNQLGLAHGGAIATLADNSMGLACLVVAQKPLVTVEFKISFLRPVSRGVLKATAKVDKLGEHLAFVGCQIVDEGGSLVARAFGTYMMTAGKP